MVIAVSKTIVTSKVVQRMPKLGPEPEDAPWSHVNYVPAGARWVIPKGIWKGIGHTATKYFKVSVYDRGTSSWVDSYDVGYSSTILISDGASVALKNTDTSSRYQGIIRIYPFKLPDFEFSPLTGSGSNKFCPSDSGYLYMMVCLNSDCTPTTSSLCGTSRCNDTPIKEGVGIISHNGEVGAQSAGGGGISYMKSNVPIF